MPTIEDKIASLSSQYEEALKIKKNADAKVKFLRQELSTLQNQHKSLQDAAKIKNLREIMASVSDEELDSYF